MVVFCKAHPRLGRKTPEWIVSLASQGVAQLTLCENNYGSAPHRKSTGRYGSSTSNLQKGTRQPSRLDVLENLVAQITNRLIVGSDLTGFAGL